MKIKTFNGILIFGMFTGISLIGQVIPDIKSLTISIVEKIFKIENKQ